MKKKQKADANSLDEIGQFVATTTRMIAGLSVEIRAIMEIMVESNMTTRDEYVSRVRRLRRDLEEFASKPPGFSRN